MKHKMLTEQELDVIVNDTWKKLPQNVSKHVVALMQHIDAMNEQACQNCRYWVPYDNVEAHRGECTYHASEESKIKIHALGEKNTVAAAVFTPFDWECRGWEEKHDEGDDAQQSLA